MVDEPDSLRSGALRTWTARGAAAVFCVGAIAPVWAFVLTDRPATSGCSAADPAAQEAYRAGLVPLHVVVMVGAALVLLSISLVRNRRVGRARIGYPTLVVLGLPALDVLVWLFEARPHPAVSLVALVVAFAIAIIGGQAPAASAIVAAAAVFAGGVWTHRLILRDRLRVATALVGLLLTLAAGDLMLVMLQGETIAC